MVNWSREESHQTTLDRLLRLHGSLYKVRPAANADPIRALAIVVPPATRVRTLMVVPAAEATKLLRPVLTADDLRALSVSSVAMSP